MPVLDIVNGEKGVIDQIATVCWSIFYLSKNELFSVIYIFLKYWTKWSNLFTHCTFNSIQLNCVTFI